MTREQSTFIVEEIETEITDHSNKLIAGLMEWPIHAIGSLTGTGAAALKRILLFCACFLLAACQVVAGETPVSGPQPTLPTVPVSWTDTSEPVILAEESTLAVFSHLLEASDGGKINVGGLAEIVVQSVPVQYGISRRGDGSVAGTSMRPWESHNVSEVQMCFSLDVPCQLTGQWLPFESAPNAGLFGTAAVQTFETPVDWVGPRTLWVVRQFRDGNGNPVPSFNDTYQDPEIISQTSIEIIGVWDETTLIEVQPPAVQTAVAMTRTAFPLTGSVQIGGGACCVGGTAGETIEVQVDFSAASPFGTVEDMRVRTTGCLSESEMAEAAWEPFVSLKKYPVYVALNWVGFYVSVQYRDEHGNLSPVYCDDISVEGFPPVLTVTP